MQTNHTPAFHYRLGLNQLIVSPTQKRLTEMAEAIGRDTDGQWASARKVRVSNCHSAICEILADRVDYLSFATRQHRAPPD